MRLTTLPVYSRLADAADVPTNIAQRLPAGWQLSQHQLATYEALCRDDVDVVINTAMTGDGKSLAGLLPLLANDRHEGTLALYPTNELIRDQLTSATHALPQWKRRDDWVNLLYGAQLDALTHEVEDLKRPEVLIRLLNNHRLILSNPDILHAILQFQYQQFGRSPDHVVERLALQFSQLTFDEFHIFETPQIVAVLTGLLFLQTQARALKTLFLSATPGDELLDLLARAQLRTQVIDPQREGWYHHGDDPGLGWRQILQGCTLNFAPQQAEEWIVSGGDQIIVNWFRAHRPGARAALIVNSAAAALRLVEYMRPLLQQEGLTVEPNTGLTGHRVRQASYQADLLIGTSTVDVGVDFRINLLIFEANSAGTFLQRLGRLGRHTSYRDAQNREQIFPAFAAYALVQPFIYARLNDAEADPTARLTSDTPYTRTDLAQRIDLAFPQSTSFRAYTRTWGRFIPAQVIHALSDKRLRTTYGPLRTELVSRYGRLIQGRIIDTLKECNQRIADGEELLIRSAQAFRGGSPFDCGVLKEDERDLVTYDLFWLLANGVLELMSQDQFCAAARRLGKPDTPYRRGYQQFFFRWIGLRPRREEVRVRFNETVAAWGTDRLQTAQIIPGLEVDCPGHNDLLDQINRKLVAYPCVGLLIAGADPKQIYRTYYLPPTLHLWRFEATSLDQGDRAGTVAFGRDALLLDSRLRSKPFGSAADAPMIY
ncbi:MAG: type I-D CRISPR-associated helicase Cas3' [Oscillochloridaceae bacterium umkhey_bin13]